MSVEAFMLALTTGAALLALWLTVRLPRLSPQRARGLTAALAGVVVAFAAAPWLVHAVGRPLGAFAAIFIVVLPALTYVFLVALWLLGFVGRLARPR
jgi:hypothetical protein